MKSNFKKLAVQAGVSAAMAAGSLAANAAINSVPATAQLVPLFYYNNVTGVDTQVRIIVPESVGADTVIGLVNGGVNPSTKWAAVSPGLAGAEIHWFWMSNTSTELLNGTIPVSPDDEVWVSAQAVDTNVGLGLNSGTPGYLLLVNDSAAFGGAPTFQFAADAYIDNQNPGVNLSLPAQISIPVLAMNDAADAGNPAYPIPSNQVVETGTADGFPDASPIFTAIRTSTTANGANFRVVDVPMYQAATVGANPYNTANVVVVWADQNRATSLWNLPAPAACVPPTFYAVDQDEQQISFPGLCLPNELNFMVVPPTAGGWTPAGTTLANTLGITDSYAQLLTGANPNAITAGFLKLVLPNEGLPAVTPEQGSYSSVVIFNIPVAVGANPVAEDSLVNGIDTGFFTSAQ